MALVQPPLPWHAPARMQDSDSDTTAGIGGRRPPAVDVHTHVEIAAVRDLASQIRLRGSGPGKRNWVPPQSRAHHAAASAAIAAELTDPRARLAAMDRQGIAVQVVSQNLPTPAYWADRRTGQRIARACNEGIAAFVARGGPRFVGLGAVPLQSPRHAVREAEVARSLGLRGLQLPSNVRNRDLGDPCFEPFWEAVEALDMPVVIHPRGFTHDDRLHEFFLWNTIGQPLEEALAMGSLIHNGVMDRYPDLKIVISHGGGYLPYYSGRGDRAFASRPEPRQHIERKPSEYFARFYYDTVIFDQDMLARLVRVAGEDRVMAGSDWPRGEVEDDPVGFVSTAPGLGATAVGKILSSNAMALFGISLPGDGP